MSNTFHFLPAWRPAYRTGRLHAEDMVGRFSILDFPFFTHFQIGRAQSELQSRRNLVCRLLLEKKNEKQNLTHRWNNK